jgi:hypothetical protein
MTDTKTYDYTSLIGSRDTLVDESFEYKGLLIQRMIFDYNWYVIIDNKIINRSQYRNDLISWIDTYLK